MAVVADKSLIGRPENAPAYAMEYVFEIGGQTLMVPVAPVEVTRDPVRGELRDALQVIPPVAVGFAEQLERFSPGETRKVIAYVTAARGDVRGEVELELPTGWTAQPAKAAFELKAVGDRFGASFDVTSPRRVESVKLGVNALVQGRSFDRSPEFVTYDHIPVQLLQPKAALIAMSFELKIRGERVGYLPGAGDTTAEALSLIGGAGYSRLQYETGVDVTT